MKTKIIILILFLTAIQINGEIRFVSKSGSSTAPYTSWQTAADSIQKALNICNPWDTVYVGSGVYKEQIVFGNGICLIGCGMDSCVIDTRDFGTETDWNTVTIKGDGTISGFHILTTRYSQAGEGIWARGNGKSHCNIYNNKMENCFDGIDYYWNSGIIKNNIFVNSQWGIYDNSFEDAIYPIIENNVFVNNKYGIYIPFGTRSTIRNNIFYLNQYNSVGLSASDPDTMYIYNNICISVNGDGGLGQAKKMAIMYNNLVYGSYLTYAMLSSTGNSDTKSNLILSKTTGLWNMAGNKNEGVKYNNSWGGKNNYIYFTPDSTNMSVNPMIVSDDSLDFHLQMYSPMIDAGDPAIKDIDGSRSDIGAYGGPYGISYSYLDLPPKIPVITGAEIKEGKIVINWTNNGEADLKCFIVYRDTVKGFGTSPANKIAVTLDSFYTGLPGVYKQLYYKITALDKQGNESMPSEEAAFNITGINEQRFVIEDYKLYQNYPNPFNPSTKIGYRLAKPGFVRLAVYDIKGSIIMELVNKYTAPGYYETSFTGESKNTNGPVESFASGIYLCRIEIKNENNIPVFTDMKKMIYLK